MNNHLYRLKRTGALLLLAGLTGLTAVFDVGVLFGFGLSLQGAVLLLAFRWYGPVAGLSLALVASLYQFVFMQNITTALLGMAEMIVVIMLAKWIRNKGLLPAATLYWFIIAPLLTIGLYHVMVGQSGSGLPLLLLYQTGNGWVNAWIAEIVYGYVPWRPGTGWRRSNLRLKLQRFLLHLAVGAMVLPFLVFMFARGTIHLAEIERDAHSITENVFNKLAYEMNHWDQRDFGMLSLNALVQVSRLETIVHSLKEASGAEMVIALDNKQVLTTTLQEQLPEIQQWNARYRVSQLYPHFSLWTSNERGFSSMDKWNNSYYVYEGALVGTPLQITVLMPTANYVHRLQHSHMTMYGIFIGLLALAAAIGLILGRWITGEFRGLVHMLPDRSYQEDEHRTGYHSIAFEELQDMADELTNLWRNQLALQRSLEQSNRSLEHQVQELDRLKAHWEHLAFHDSLTGVHNSLYFYNTLEHLIVEQYGTGASVGVIAIDLDSFQQLSDQHGHSVRNEWLKQVAKRMCQTIEKGTVCRIGGDEFVVLVPKTRPLEVKHLSMQLLQAMKEPFSLDGRLLDVKSSLGISLYPQDAYDTETIMQYANEAMYRAKASGGNCYAFYGDFDGIQEQLVVTGGGER